MDPIVIINLKTYSKGTGEEALEIAKTCERVAKEEDADIRLAVQAVDLRMIAREVDIPVYGQHLDEIEAGSHTGWTLAEALKEAGAVGTLLNHSEHRMRMERIKECFERARDVGFDVVICAKDSEVGGRVASLGPDFVAVEPPELIGGDVSVSSAQPDLIRDSFESVTEEAGVDLLVGAGVKDGSDVRKSLELGAKGVLIASGVVKADNPEEVLRDLVNP